MKKYLAKFSKIFPQKKFFNIIFQLKNKKRGHKMKIGDKLYCIKNKSKMFIQNNMYFIKKIETIYNNEYLIYTIIHINSEYDVAFNFVDKYNENLFIDLWETWVLKDHFCTLKESRKYKLKKITQENS